MKQKENSEWKNLIDNLTVDELYWVQNRDTTIINHPYPNIGETFAKLSLTCPSIVSEYEPYLDFFTYLVTSVIQDPDAYQLRTVECNHGEGKIFRYQEAPALRIPDIMGYFIDFLPAHAVTFDLPEEKRLHFLTKYQRNECPWGNLQRAVDEHDYYGRHGWPPGKKSVFTNEEFEALNKREWMDLQTLQCLWDDGGEQMIKMSSFVSYAGGKGSPAILLAYSSGQTIPENLLPILDPADIRLIPDRQLTSDDPQFLSPRSYTLMELRQKMKGIGIKCNINRAR